MAMTVEKATLLSLRNGKWWTQNSLRAMHVRRKVILAVALLVEHGYLKTTGRFKTEFANERLQKTFTERLSLLDKFEVEACDRELLRCSKDTLRWWKGVT